MIEKLTNSAIIIEKSSSLKNIITGLCSGLIAANNPENLRLINLTVPNKKNYIIYVTEVDISHKMIQHVQEQKLDRNTRFEPTIFEYFISVFEPKDNEIYNISLFEAIMMNDVIVENNAGVLSEEEEKKLNALFEDETEKDLDNNEIIHIGKLIDKQMNEKESDTDSVAWYLDEPGWTLIELIPSEKETTQATDML